MIRRTAAALATALLALTFAVPANAQVSGAQLITTVAGMGVDASTGDGGLAIDAGLFHPVDVAFDAAGNMFVAELSGNRVRKIDTNGVITTLAGNGLPENSGDGGAASEAGVFAPSGLAFDSAGNLYIASLWGNVVRRVDTSGVITTVAGGGPGPVGDGGQATSATLSFSSDVTVDATDNVFIAELMGQRVRMVTPAGIISTVAGTGGDGPLGDNGPATAASLSPATVQIGPEGHLYVSEFGGHRIRRVDLDSGVITTVVGDGTSGVPVEGVLANETSVGSAHGMAFDELGQMFFGDVSDGRIWVVDLAGRVHRVGGLGLDESFGDGGAALDAAIATPHGMAFDSAGNLVITERLTSRVRRISATEMPSPHAPPTCENEVSTGYNDSESIFRTADRLGMQSVDVQRAGVHVIRFINAISGVDHPDPLPATFSTDGTTIFHSCWAEDELPILQWVTDGYGISAEEAQAFGATLLVFLTALTPE